MHCVFILLNYQVFVNIQLNRLYNFLLSMVFVGSESVSFDTDPDPAQLLIRIRIQGNYTDPADPDPQHR